MKPARPRQKPDDPVCHECANFAEDIGVDEHGRLRQHRMSKLDRRWCPGSGGKPVGFRDSVDETARTFAEHWRDGDFDGQKDPPGMREWILVRPQILVPLLRAWPFAARVKARRAQICGWTSGRIFSWQEGGTVAVAEITGMLHYVDPGELQLRDRGPMGHVWDRYVDELEASFR